MQAKGGRSTDGEGCWRKTCFHGWRTSHARVVMSSCTPWQNSRNPGSVQACTCGPRKATWPAARATLHFCSCPRADAAQLCRAGPLPPQGRDQALLCLPSSALKRGEVAVISHRHLHAAGCAVREGRSYQPGRFCSPLSSFLEGDRHMAELHCDGHKAVFKTQYPSFAHSR